VPETTDQRTLSPAWMVNSGGSKAKLRIRTS
jgi:hypothetical protein